MKVLIIEDNKILAENTLEYLKLKKIDWKIASSVELAKIFLWEENFDLILLDINLPWENWLEFCANLREKGDNIPVIFLTSRDSKKDIILWLDSGWDDYLVKPFDFEELLSRIKSVFRRKNNFVSENIILWDLEINPLKKEVFKNKKEIILSNTEYKLLEFFLKNRWKILDRATIYEEVWWEFEKYQLSRNTDIYINKLRKKLWKDFIKTKIWAWYYID
jgi:DNA-binding response OmpR family regulator